MKRTFMTLLLGAACFGLSACTDTGVDEAYDTSTPRQEGQQGTTMGETQQDQQSTQFGEEQQQRQLDQGTQPGAGQEQEQFGQQPGTQGTQDAPAGADEPETATGE